MSEGLRQTCFRLCACSARYACETLLLIWLAPADNKGMTDWDMIPTILTYTSREYARLVFAPYSWVLKFSAKKRLELFCTSAGALLWADGLHTRDR